MRCRAKGQRCLMIQMDEVDAVLKRGWRLKGNGVVGVCFDQDFRKSKAELEE